MSTTAEDTKQEHEDRVAGDVAMDVGDSPAAAETVAEDAIRWFRIVEIPEVGFEAFCRLPNDYQHKDIREKAMAAKARRIRQLKHPDTDANVVLEAELDAIAETPDALESLVHELLQQTYFRDRDEAHKDVQEDEKFANLRQDQERWREIDAMSPDERPEDEWRELTEHLGNYAMAVDKRLNEIRRPQAEALRGLGVDGLIEKVREARIEADARRVFMDTYSAWQMFVGTLKLTDDFDPTKVQAHTMPRERYFPSIEAMREEDPFLISRLTEAFEALEGDLSSLTAGNS